MRTGRGPFGPDKAKGGKFLVPPPRYIRDVPAGYRAVLMHEIRG